ncbi:hypothetical protein PUN28_005920 [Cardiocondyla obscurior]|uniref:Uncharacterized protein n=1 Tax=Cardiocondyla obscurior TaxID=286306 RepID=A0AAW2G6E2_9HYME
MSARRDERHAHSSAARTCGALSSADSEDARNEGERARGLVRRVARHARHTAYAVRAERKAERVLLSLSLRKKRDVRGKRDTGRSAAGRSRRRSTSRTDRVSRALATDTVASRGRFDLGIELWENAAELRKRGPAGAKRAGETRGEVSGGARGAILYSGREIASSRASLNAARQYSAARLACLALTD